MSEIQRLKQELNAIAAEAKKTAGGLSSLKPKLSNSAQQVQRTIGGTAKRTDQQMIQTLQAAEKQVEAAIAALQKAATTAQQFSSSL